MLPRALAPANRCYHSQPQKVLMTSVVRAWSPGERAVETHRSRPGDQALAFGLSEAQHSKLSCTFCLSELGARNTHPLETSLTRHGNLMSQKNLSKQRWWRVRWDSRCLLSVPEDGGWVSPGEGINPRPGACPLPQPEDCIHQMGSATL